MHFEIRTAITFASLLLLGSKGLHASSAFGNLDSLPKAFTDTMAFLRNNVFMRITARPPARSIHNDSSEDALIEEGYVLVSEEEEDDQDDTPGADFLASESVDDARGMEEPIASAGIMSETLKALSVPSPVETEPTIVDVHTENPIISTVTEEALPTSSKDPVEKQAILEPEHVQSVQQEVVDVRDVDRAAVDLPQEPSVPRSQPVEVALQETIEETAPVIVTPPITITQKAKSVKKRQSVKWSDTVESLGTPLRVPLPDTPSAEQAKEKHTLPMGPLPCTESSQDGDSDTSSLPSYMMPVKVISDTSGQIKGQPTLLFPVSSEDLEESWKFMHVLRTTPEKLSKASKDSSVSPSMASPQPKPKSTPSPREEPKATPLQVPVKQESVELTKEPKTEKQGQSSGVCKGKHARPCTVFTQALWTEHFDPVGIAIHAHASQGASSYFICRSEQISKGLVKWWMWYERGGRLRGITFDHQFSEKQRHDPLKEDIRERAEGRFLKAFEKMFPVGSGECTEVSALDPSSDCYQPIDSISYKDTEKYIHALNHKYPMASPMFCRAYSLMFEASGARFNLELFAKSFKYLLASFNEKQMLPRLSPSDLHNFYRRGKKEGYVCRIV